MRRSHVFRHGARSASKIGHRSDAVLQHGGLDCKPSAQGHTGRSDLRRVDTADAQQESRSPPDSARSWWDRNTLWRPGHFQGRNHDFIVAAGAVA